MAIRNFRELIVWQKAMDLVERIYTVTADFPTKEMFGLTNQVRRAAVSIPSNIAEGQGRSTTRDFLQFLSIAKGSLQEVQTQAEVARRLKYLDESSFADLMDRSEEVARLLNGLCRSLRSD